jgi:hypothetical protein
MRKITLDASQRIQQASFLQLVYQGLYLHYASLWGPLRASKAFRDQNTNWILKVLTRWFKEYGLNFVVLLLSLATFIFYVPNAIFLGIVFSLILLPTLTIVQMLIDSFRKDIIILFDTKALSGLTVKFSTDINGRVIWSFYNHFALPIGDKKGIFLRSYLHTLAIEQKVLLVCHAQSETIAKYYLTEKPCGNNLGGARPFMIWNYTLDADNMIIEHKKEHFLSKIFGVSSIRNSGQFPLKNLKVVL